MTYSTDSLKNEAGVQFDEVILIGEDDKQVVGLIAGQFKRGRMDKPMTVTLENIRSVLGHDPRNPDYVAIVDVLTFGIPSVQVMRIAGDFYSYDHLEYGPWILGENIEVLGTGVARYSAYKTNNLTTYDSHADFDLSTALFRSFHDADMQQWQAFTLVNNYTWLNDWYVTDVAASFGASVRVSGKKHLVADGIKQVADGIATITPNTTQVAKVLALGAASDALSVAVEQLIDAIDWVLDPANNRIKYYVDIDPTQPDPTSPYEYKGIGGYGVVCSPNYQGGKLPSKAAAYADAVACYGTFKNGSVTHVVDTQYVYEVWFVNSQSSSDKDVAMYEPMANPAYDPTAEPEQKSLPLDVVAQQVISNAESGDTHAQVATTAAVYLMLGEMEKGDALFLDIENQFENSKVVTADASNDPRHDIAQQIISNTQSADQGTALLAETYIQAVTESIFNENPAKRFVKLSDLLAQFEQNQVLRK